MSDYTIRRWVSDMAMRSLAECVQAGNHTAAASVISAMGVAGLIDERRILNPEIARGLTRQETTNPTTIPPPNPFPISAPIDEVPGPPPVSPRMTRDGPIRG